VKNFKAIALLPALSLSWLLPNWGIAQQVPEIPRRFMPGIAKVEQTPRGPVIFYNPATCRRLGPQACAFFRAHEYAHIQLNHLNRNIPVRQAEAEADMYASRMVSRPVSAAAQRYFRRGNGGSINHGTAWQRARRVHQAANGSALYPTTYANSNRNYPTRNSYSATRRPICIGPHCNSRSGQVFIVPGNRQVYPVQRGFPSERPFVARR
jgi:hypothetical protein